MPGGETESESSLEQSHEPSGDKSIESFLEQSQEPSGDKSILSSSFVSAESGEISSQEDEEKSVQEDEDDSQSPPYSQDESQFSLPLSIFSQYENIKNRLTSTRPSRSRSQAASRLPQATSRSPQAIVSSIPNRIKNAISYLIHAVARFFGLEEAEKESESDRPLSRKTSHSVSRKKIDSRSRKKIDSVSRKKIDSVSRKKTDSVLREITDSVPREKTDSLPHKEIDPREKTDSLPHKETDPREKTDSLPHKETDPGVEEILAYPDTFYWRRDKHTLIYKRHPDTYTVFEIKKDNDPDKGKKTKKTETKKPSIQKAKETTPLGTTVYRQPALGICIGSQQISGSVKVVLDYNQKVAFVQIISPKSEVYATYNVNSITFLTTCNPLGASWIGDIYLPDNKKSVPGTSGKQSRISGGKPASRFSKETESASSLQFSRQSPGKPPDHNQSSVPKSDMDNADLIPKLSSKTLQLLLAESEERIFRNDTENQSEKDSTSTTKKVSGGSQKEILSTDVVNSQEEILSIDVVNVVFSNPDKVQRLIKIVEKLKTALSYRVLPGSATFYDSTYICGSSSDASSTSLILSNASSDHESPTSLSPNYYNLASQFYNLQRSPKGPSPEVTGQADAEQQKYFTSTESPQREHKDTGNIDKALQPNDKNTDTLPGKQNGVQQATNNVLPISAPNSQTGLQANNYSLQNRNVTGLGQQQTGVSQKIHNIQNQPVFFNQNPCRLLNTTPPVYTIQNQLPQGCKLRDFLNSGNITNQISPASKNIMFSPTIKYEPSMNTNKIPAPFGNQMLPGSRNQMFLDSRYQMPSIPGNLMPSTNINQMYLASGNQAPSSWSWCQEQMRVASNSGGSPLQNKRGRIFRSANPASIRRQWSLTKPKPCNKVRVCLVSEPD